MAVNHLVGGSSPSRGARNIKGLEKFTLWAFFNTQQYTQHLTPQPVKSGLLIGPSRLLDHATKKVPRSLPRSAIPGRGFLPTRTLPHGSFLGHSFLALPLPCLGNHVQMKSWMKVSPVQFPRYLHFQQDLSVGILFTLLLFSIESLCSIRPRISKSPGFGEFGSDVYIIGELLFSISR